jgi:chromate reductase, NAD(P)H dehydrogenase (quinone)
MISFESNLRASIILGIELMRNIQILAISGSLRSKSSNTTVLQALQKLAPETIKITLYSELPHFNPDLDQKPLPDCILSLRQQIKASDGIVISSPEYAHGVPGSLKNALDWLVSSIEFPGKPVALINTNPRAIIALASLTEILITMSAQIIEPANITLHIAGRSLDVNGIVVEPELSKSLKKSLSIFTQAILQRLP